jgi:hypothetical protein
LRHGAAALENEVLKLPPPAVKLVPRNLLFGDRPALVDLVS